ncbi:MAG: DMT family protein [Phycisphaeraceae bacterium]|nr:DMT family protein [Phycisphaeraceae bacterium]
MRPFTPILLLAIANIFMTYAWYGHLRDLKHRTLIVAIVASWLVAFFEYCFQVPANRLGFGDGQGPYTLGQLKVIQEVLTMTIFAAFAAGYLRQPITLNYLWASLCLVGAAFFIFRDQVPSAALPTIPAP